MAAWSSSEPEPGPLKGRDNDNNNRVRAMQTTAIEVAPARLPSSLKGLGLIYGLAIASCFLVNMTVRSAPIGPWTGEQVGEMYWLDNVTWQLLALWWVLLSVVSGGYPFHRI